MLKLIVFVCGAALMSLEIVAARVLAPWLGNSIFVWGAVISTVMLALALGYWLGGQAADRLGAAATLPAAIAAAGLLTVLAPLVADWTLPLAAGLGPRTGALAAATLVFFLPALFLATVSPLGVRLAAGTALDRIGRSAGGLYAVSTAGSIVGTIATSFWLIPLLSLEPLIVATGFVLFGAAGLAVLLARREAAAVGWPAPALLAVGIAAGAYVLFGVAPAPAFTAAGETIRLREDTLYHRLMVTEAGGIRELRFDLSEQTAMVIDDPTASVLEYPDYLHIAFAMRPDARRVLVVGLGGATLPKRILRDYPGMSVDVVELDPRVVEVAAAWFAMPAGDPRLAIHVMDGRRFVQTTTATYDVIVLDAYYADTLPFHLTTQDFFRELKARLTPGGVIAYNVIASVEGRRSLLFRSMARTVGSVFAQTLAFPIHVARYGNPQSLRNIIVLATDAPVERRALLAAIASRARGMITIGGFENFGADLWEKPVSFAGAPLLTDRYSPVDWLIQGD